MTFLPGLRCRAVEYERLAAAVRELGAMDGGLTRMAKVLSPAEVWSSDRAERDVRAALAYEALRLLEDAENALAAGEGEDVLTALVHTANGLCEQLRDRILDDVVAASPPPDHP